MVTSEKAESKAKFRRVEVVGSNNGELEAMILVSSVLEVNKCLSNSIYGYFTGKMIVFIIVKNNVFNAWGKYGIMKTMKNGTNYSHQKKVKDNKENDKIKTKPDKIKSKQDAWKSPDSSPTKSKPSQSQESIKGEKMPREVKAVYE
nr:hypothetical protein [Tanacetum cinerariifolium]